MNDIVKLDYFLKDFIHSDNHLGTVYRIPRNCVLNLDFDLIMQNYIGCTVETFRDYTQIVIAKTRGTLKSRELL